MAASVEHRFTRGFLLDEEKLRKLVSLITERLAKSEPPIPHRFRVFRADSYSYETSNVDDIVNEDHADWRKITRLQIEASREKEFEFELTFSDEGTTLELNGEDRDQVYLLLSDLREYLKNEVNTCLLISRQTHMSLSLILPLVLVAVVGVLTLWKITESPSQADIQRALDSGQVGEKLDLLVQQLRRPGEHFSLLAVWFGSMPLMALLMFSGAIRRIIVFFCPSNLFLFGSQKHKYERRKRLLAKILWALIIGFLISVVAGLAVWKVTN